MSQELCIFANSPNYLNRFETIKIIVMMKNVLKKFIFLLFSFVISTHIFGQLPDPAMVGYWESWRDLKLKNIDSRYNVIQVSFAKGQNRTDYDLVYTNNYSDSVSGYVYKNTNPEDFRYLLDESNDSLFNDSVFAVIVDSLNTIDKNYNDSLYEAINDSVFKSEIKALQSEGKKVLISIGGQNDPVMLDSIQEKNVFVSSVNEMIDKWGFDGLDIDLEGASLQFNDIKIQTPGDIRIQYMIDGIKEIMNNHHVKHGKRLLLTMAPETAYVQGGMSNWTVTYAHGGAYLPIIEALKDSIDMLNVQLYNSGSQYGLDGEVYSQGSADWILSMTEAVIQGFECVGNIGKYNGIPSSKVGVALPGCHSDDAVPHKEMEAAMRYLIGEGPQPGSYELIQEGGYPDLKGMMTWSINSDKGCNPSYGFVDTWSKVFTSNPYIEIKNSDEIYEGQEDGKIIEVELFNDVFKDSLDSAGWMINNLPSGVELDSIKRINDTIVHLVLKGNANETYLKTNFNTTVEIDSSEFKNFSNQLSRNRGAVLKPEISVIPGYVEIEKYVKYKGCGVGNISEADGGGKFGWIWENHWAEIEVDIAESGDYIADFRYRTDAKKTHKCILKVDGVIKSFNKIKSSTKWNVWENKEFDIKLTEGIHKLTFQMSNGWLHLDRVDFRSTLSDNSFTVFNKTFFYPNPASQILTFGNELKGTVNIFGIRGELVKQVSLNEKSQINIGDLKTGIYTVQLLDFNGALYHDKLVKK